MRIAHVYKSYAPEYGGIESHIRALATELVRRHGFEVEVLVAGAGAGTTRDVDRGVRVTRAGRQLEVAQTPLSWQLCRELARLNADVVHLHVPYPLGELAYLVLARCPRLIVTYQGAE
jgi:glycosyltransferase involved in cell wall biosynthesis